jgi:hypothetical protein
VNSDLECSGFHVGERVTNFSELVNLFFHLAQNSLRNEPESRCNHHCKETILKPSGAFDEKEESTAEDRAEKQEETFEDCVFHVGESLEF